MKTKLYAFFTALLVLAGLAGCSPNQSLRQSPAVAAPTPARVPLAAPARPAVPGRVRRPGAAQRRPLAATRLFRRGHPIALPEATVIGQGASQRADIKYCGLIPTYSRESSADGGLLTFCAQSAPQEQQFVVRPGRDTVLLGQQGTRLLIPGRAFDVPAGSGPVTLSLREFYSTADIVLAGLGTRAGLDVLETGGMLHLAAAANGQAVHLRPAKKLRVQLPTRQPLPGMSLYEGVRADASHAPDWQLAGPGVVRTLAGAKLRQRARATGPKQGDRWPSLPKGNGTLQPLLDQLAPLTAADLARLAQLTPADRNERRWWKAVGRNKQLPIKYMQRIVVLADSTGTIQDTFAQRGDSVLGRSLSAAVKQLPALRPASYLAWAAPHRRRCTAARGLLQVLYTKDGQRLAHLEWQWLAKPDWPAEDVEDVIESRAAFARQFGSGSTPLTLASGLYYELAAGGLGWINCDRLLDPGPRIRYTVALPAPATVVALVFQGQRSILASSYTEGSAAIFEQVPSGQAATVVALCRQGGVTYLATSGVRLGQPAAPTLSFHPVTLEQLRTELAQL
jgi:hypothetical protein